MPYFPGAAAVLAAALLAAAAKASAAGTFDAIRANLAVTFEGNTWTQEVQYTCNEATVAYTLIPGIVTLTRCRNHLKAQTGDLVVSCKNKKKKF